MPTEEEWVHIESEDGLGIAMSHGSPVHTLLESSRQGPELTIRWGEKDACWQGYVALVDKVYLHAAEVIGTPPPIVCETFERHRLPLETDCQELHSWVLAIGYHLAVERNQRLLRRLARAEEMVEMQNHEIDNFPVR